MNKSKLTASTVIAIIVLAILMAILAVLFYLWGDQFIHFTARIFRNGFVFSVLFLLPAALAAIFFFKERRIPFFTTLTVAVIGLIVSIGISFVGSYNKASFYNQYTNISEEANLEYGDRAPFDVAQSVSTRTLGDTTGEATGIVKAIPAEGEHGIYTTSIIRRGMFQGYESTQTMNIPLYGTANNSNVEFCHFDENNKLRFGGVVPSNNLVRAIYKETPMDTKVDRDDAFIVCENDAPIIYAPIVDLKGWIFPKWVPYGVATYNGKTGELNIHEEMTDTNLPVYPQSIAQKQRVSNQASNGFIDYFFKRAGYEDTSGDENDPNGANRSDFGLARDGESYFVSPLTSRGSSTSIVALGEIQSNTIKRGELNEYTIQKYKDGESRQANSSIAQRITGDLLEGYKAQGLTVFEIVPNQNNEWVASIGNNQNVRYRATIKSNGDIILGKAAGENAPVDENGEPQSPDLQTGKDLATMSDEELKKMMNMIFDEITSRNTEE